MLISTPKPTPDLNAEPKSTAKGPKKSLPPKADTPKFTKLVINMLIKHCKRISYDNMQIQAAIVKTQLKSDRLRITTARLENDTITKKVEGWRLSSSWETKWSEGCRATVIVFLFCPPSAYVHCNCIVVLSTKCVCMCRCSIIILVFLFPVRILQHISSELIPCTRWDTRLEGTSFICTTDLNHSLQVRLTGFVIGDRSLIRK